MSDPNSTFVDRGNPFTGDAGSQATVGGPNTFHAAQPLARSDAPADGVSGRGQLSAAEKAEFAAALATSKNPGETLRQLWAKRAAGEPTTASTDPSQQQANSQDQAQGQATDAQIDAHVREVSDGQVTGAALFAADGLARGVIETMSKMDVPTFNAAWDKGIAEVEKTIYGGNADAFAAGLGEMAAAAVRLTGSKEAGAKLMNDIDATGVLANPGVHYKLLTMARQLLARRTSVFKK